MENENYDQQTTLRTNSEAENLQKTIKRPRSLTFVSIFILVLFAAGYLLAVGSLLTGTQGITLSRLIIEPSENEGGIPWPGWDEMGSVMRGEMGTLESIPAKYWWAKLKHAGSLLVGPLFILGFLGVYIGKEWGRTCLYIYTSVWLSNKVIYLILMGAAGVFKFSIAVGMAVLLVIVLRSESWSSWIKQKPGLNG